MTRLRYACLCLLVLMLGCADGGPVGTGISSLSGISGNVVSVDAANGGGGAVAGVRVSIDEAPGLETVTDAGGNFELSGNFAGAVTLRFRTGGITATEQVDVPDDSNVVLQDIVVRRGTVQIETVRVLGFFGQVALVDCDARLLLVNDRRAVPNQFLVRITEDTVLIRGDGRALRCTDIDAGNSVAVEGAVRFVDRTIAAFTLTVGPAPPGSRPPILEVRIRGRAAVISCAGGMLLLEDPATGRTRLRLSEQTAITRNGAPIACDAILLGDQVEGRGTINVRRPEVVEALALTIRPPR